MMIIKKVLGRKVDGMKFVIVTRECSIKIGDYVKIEKIEEDKDDNTSM